MSDWKRLLARNLKTEQLPDSHFARTSLEVPAHLLRLATNLKLAREERDRYFASELFGEAGWDILLALYIARGRGYPMKVSDACFEARVPTTTALRWLEHIENAGLIDRRSNAVDKRSTQVEISAQGIVRMSEYLSTAQQLLSRE